MNYHFVPMNNQGRECVENVIITVLAALYGIEYLAAFCDSWGFQYEELSTSGVWLSDGWGSIERRAEEYLGMGISFLKVCNCLEAYEEVCRLVSTYGAVAFVLDIRFCPWHPWSNTDTVKEHTLLVNDVLPDGVLKCIDCQYQITDIALGKSKFQSGYLGTIIRFVPEEKPLERKDWFAPIYQTITKLTRNGVHLTAFDEMRIFREKICSDNQFRGDINTSEEKIWNSPILYKIKNLSIGRLQYGKYIDLLIELSGKNELHPVKKILVDSGNRWATIYSMLLKAAVSGYTTKSRKRIYDMIGECASMEEAACNYLKQKYNSAFM